MDILDRVSVFDDSEELADVLGNMAVRGEEIDYADCYYLKECEVHIEGMWVLVNELAKEVKKLRKKIG